MVRVGKTKHMLSIVQSRLSLNVMEIICWCHEHRSSSSIFDASLIYTHARVEIRVNAHVSMHAWILKLSA